ncbi:MAG: hypothetical protein QXF86_03175 [Candidatus Bilamarchaeaceae archaeon]
MILLVNYDNFIFELYETKLIKKEIYQKLKEAEEYRKMKNWSISIPRLFETLEDGGLIKRIKFEEIHIPKGMPDKEIEITNNGIKEVSI